MALFLLHVQLLVLEIVFGKIDGFSTSLPRKKNPTTFFLRGRMMKKMQFRFNLGSRRKKELESNIFSSLEAFFLEIWSKNSFSKVISS